MRVRDLFAGQVVTLRPYEDRWVVSVADPDGRHTVQHYAFTDLPDALEAVHEFALMWVDDTEVGGDAASARADVADMMREMLGRYVAGEGIEAGDMERAVERDRLKVWFDKQMES